MADEQHTEALEQPPQRGQRKLRNILIDKGIQLRLTFTSMVIILVMCLALGAALIWQHSDARRFFSDQRTKATAMYKRQLDDNTRLIKSIRKQSTKDMKKLLRTATEMLDVQLKDKDPATREMAALAKQALLKDDKIRLKRRLANDERLNQRRVKNDKEQISLRKHQDLEASLLESGQFMLTIAFLVVFGLLMLALIFVFSLKMTHRVAGPLFKIGRYVDDIRDGKLGEVHALRKSDLLQEFHQRFSEMHDALKARNARDIEVLASIQEVLQEHGVDDEAAEQLNQLLEEKRNAIS